MPHSVEESLVKAKKPDKRAAIIEAARVLFTTQGYETTTIADVAKKAGIAVGTVYLYFKNKPELLYAVKDAWEQQLVESMLSPELAELPYQGQIYPMLKACFDICAEKTEMVQMMSLPPQLIGEVENHLPRKAAYIGGLLEQFLNNGIQAGAFRQFDTKTGAVLAFGLVSQALYQCFEVEQGQNQERYIEAITDLFSHWLVK